MKIIKFNDFDSSTSVYEYRTKGSLNKNKRESFADTDEETTSDTPVDDNSTKVVLDGEAVDVEDVDMKDFVGVKADNNPSHGVFDVDIPTEEDAVRFDDKKIWSENLENLWAAISSHTNFFVQGEAGWAKTDLITQMAKKCGYHVITVYLDKALPEDLAGLTATKEYTTDSGRKAIRQETAMPVWAQFMLDNPDKQFLLFFDELNQTTNDVMKALMPICHPKKRVICGTLFNNYFVGAAGNMDYENDLESIPRPLMARLGGHPIAWITGVDKDKAKAKEAWDDAFDYLHKAWDSKLGKDLVSLFSKYRLIFAAPRDIELNIFEFIYNYKQFNANSKNYNRISERKLKQQIKSQTFTVEGTQQGNQNGNMYTTAIDMQVEELAKTCYDWLMENGVANNETNKPKRSMTSKDDDDEDLDNNDVKSYVELAVSGEYKAKDNDGNEVVIPITPETLIEFFGASKVMVDVVKNSMKKKGLSWAYPTIDDAVATGKWTKEDLGIE